MDEKNSKLTNAGKRGSVVLSHENWRDLAFVDVANNNAWRPVPEFGGDDDMGYSENWAIGKHYAMELIEHIRDYAAPGWADSGEPLSTVMEAMVKGGKFGDIERAFCHSLGQYIGTGEVSMTCFFNASMEPMDRPADAIDYEAGGGTTETTLVFSDCTPLTERQTKVARALIAMPAARLDAIEALILHDAEMVQPTS